MEHLARFRFYEELNDFLPPERRKRDLDYRFDGHPGIKDPIEALGVPHTEVELIVVNGESVGFDYRLRDGDRVAVYPVFESFDVTPLVRLRQRPLRHTAFMVDANLGKLARRLRLLGFDAAYCRDCDDAEVVRRGVGERRIILTRDRRLLHHKVITHGYWVRGVAVDAQVREVLARFDLAAAIRPFHRCIDCNGRVVEVDKAAVIDELEPLTRKYYDDFHRCEACGKVYWRGSHAARLEALISRYTDGCDGNR